MAENVGILAMELYVPFLYVEQTELEEFCGESRGKYTIGLGQERMGFCSDLEDVQSLCLTVVSRLLANYSIDPRQIGRLEVGTETIVDKSKSVKTVLMRLFSDCGNTDIEGVDAKNACFGGTQALFNAVNWIESSYWDGRFALVVAADVAVYGEGPARCTGGAGSLAMLIGPNAPLVFEKGLRATYSKDVYDFYKPDLSSEFPVVDGTLSIQCYLSALDHCYSLYCRKALQKGKHITMADFDGFVFHSPFSKLVQKAFARLVYLDVLNNTALPYASISEMAEYKKTNPNETYGDKNLEKAFMSFSLPVFKSKTEPSLEIGKNVGNMYTPSVYAALISYLINTSLERLPGSTIGIFSYGSGLIATIFAIEIAKNPKSVQQLNDMVAKLSSIKAALQSRRKVTPTEFVSAVNLRTHAHNKAPYVPVSSKDDLFNDVYHLTQIDEKHRRHYHVKSTSKLNGLSHGGPGQV